MNFLLSETWKWSRRCKSRHFISV